MHSRHGVGIVALCALAGSAMGQAQIAYDVDENPFDFQLQYSTAPSVGVSGLAAVVLGTHEMALFDKAGNKIDSRDWFFELPDPTYPFAPGNDGALFLRSLVFPRAEYDPLTGRLWMFYSEAFNAAPESAPDCTPILHIAVDKGAGGFHPNPGLLEGLGDDHWWFYTGNASDMTEGNGGVAFALSSTSVDPFREADPPEIPLGSHDPLQDTALLASYGFDERAIVAAMSSRIVCADDGIDAFEQYIYLIPRSNNDFSTNDEWLIDGFRADEDDFLCIQMRDRPLIADDSVLGHVVQEPYEQYANATFLVSTAGSQPGDSQTAIRVKGIFYNDRGTPEDPSDDQWEVRQSLEQDAGAPQGWRLFDSDIGDPLLNFFRPTDADYPDAPDFSPTVEGDFITSAVLTKDASGTPPLPTTALVTRVTAGLCSGM